MHDTSAATTSTQAVYAECLAALQWPLRGFVRGLVGDGRRLFLASQAAVMALNPRDGSVLWQTATPDAAGDVVPPVAYANGSVFEGGDPVRAFDAATGRVLWHFSPAQSVHMAPIVAGSRVYLRDVNEAVYALQADTGALVWQRPVATDGYAGIAVADGEVFAAGSQLVALDAASGSQLWSFAAGPNVYTPGVGP